MIQEILALSKVLMVVPSIKNDPKSIDLALEIADQELYGLPAKRYEKNGVPSLLYANKEWTKPEFKILLNTNLDVVEADKSNFRPYKKDGKLFGRGAYAMKAPAAAMILAFKHAAPEVSYPLALQIITDEETGGENTTLHQIEEGVRSEFVLTSASTVNFSMSNETKGVLWLKIKSKGKMAHTAYPWKGKNAVTEMNRFIRTLEEVFPTPNTDEWVTTVAVSHIKTSNTTFNNIPSECEAWIDVRYINEEKESILQKIKQLLPEDFSLEITFDQKPQYTSPDNAYIQHLQKSFEKIAGKKPEIVKKNFMDQLGHYNTINIPGVGFSPVGGDSHTDHEWVDLESLEQYYHILKEFLLSVA